MDTKELKSVCTKVRRDIINMVADASSGHPGGSLSATELLVGLYFTQMNIDPKNPKMESRDRFVMSKGHACPAYYGTLCERGFFPESELSGFRQIGRILQGHPSSKLVPGVDASSGSLGQGISVAAGMALGAKLAKSDVKVYALMGDGEMQEGLVWEACMAAAHYKLDNFTVIIDNNGLQIDGKNDEVMSLGNLAGKMRAFGFHVIEVADGNDIEQVVAAYNQPTEAGKPRCILAHTVKGKGVSFMENQAGWHGKAPNAEQRAQALSELEV